MADEASASTGGVSIFNALEKQLALKLEMEKRPVQVLAIDHVEQKPTENQPYGVHAIRSYGLAALADTS